jgi:N-acetylglucosamine-6-phosphate deacetylase
VTTVLAGQLCPPGEPEPGWVAIEDGMIVDVVRGRAPSDALHLGDALLTPGFVDLQVNGLGHVDFAHLDAEAWGDTGRAFVAHGTTACCPTLVSAPLDAYDDRLRRIEDHAGNAQLAISLGAHLEGPFLGGAPGAHDARLLRQADAAWLDRIVDSHAVRIATLAPEADPGLTATTALAGRGVVVALGHSTASYDEARAAADAGASVVTHLFNGMGPLHHRDPGLAGACLDDERLTPTLIADLVHVHPAALRLAIHRKRKVALVTDAVATGVGDAPLLARDGAAWLPDGTLAGSLLTMDQAVRNVVGLGIPIGRAVEMASTIPAEIVGDETRGRLEAGRRADIVALDANTLTARAVWLAGRAVFGA